MKYKEMLTRLILKRKKIKYLKNLVFQFDELNFLTEKFSTKN